MSPRSGALAAAATLAIVLAAASLPGSRALAAEASLGNGAPLLVEVDPGLPRQIVRLTFAGGPGMIPPDRQGLTGIVGEVFRDGAMSLRDDAYRRRLFLLNASIDVSADNRAIHVTITAPPDQLQPTLEIGRQVLAQPALDRKSFDAARGKVLAEADQLADNMQAFIFYFGLRDAFGYHPDLLDGEATRKTVQNITLEQVKERLPALLDYRHVSVASAGPVPVDKLEALVDRVFFAPELQRPKYTGYTFQPIDVARFERDTLKVTLIHKADATDNQILFVYPEAWKQDTPEQAVANVAHVILGDGVSSRLGSTLRGKRGLTYHAGSFLFPGLPIWMVWTFGGVAQTGPLIAGVPEVIAAFRKEKLKPTEVREAAARHTAGWKQALELPLDRLSKVAKFRLFGLDPGYIARHEGALGAVSAAEVQGFARERIDHRGGYLYVMGDRAKLAPMLEKLAPAGTPLRIVELGDIP